MAERNGRSPSPPSPRPEKTVPPTAAQLFGLLLSSLGVGPPQQGEKLTAWAKQWAAVLRQTREALEEMARQVAPQLKALREWAESPEAQRFALGLASMAEVMECAPSYCVPYNRELAQLGLPPLTKGEQHEFLLIAVLLQGREAQELGRRVPLVQVALAAGRHEIAAAIVVSRRLTEADIHQLERGGAREEGDLLTEAYLALRKQILPSIGRRLSRIPMGDVRRIAGPMLEQVVRDAYLLKSIQRALVRQLEREGRRAGEGPWGQEAQEKADQLKQRLASDDPEQSWDVESALASFLARPRASELDRELVEEFRRDPDASAREIAKRIGRPIRTVQDHRKKLIDHVRKQLDI